MAATTIERKAPQLGAMRPTDFYTLPMKASTKILAGTIVMIDAGYAAPGATATGKIAAGLADETVDNTAGAAGALSIRVKPGVFKFVNLAADPVVAAGVGTDCWIADNQSVAATNGGATRSRAGVVVQLEADGVFVQLGFGVLGAHHGHRSHQFQPSQHSARVSLRLRRGFRQDRRALVHAARDGDPVLVQRERDRLDEPAPSLPRVGWRARSQRHRDQRIHAEEQEVRVFVQGPDGRDRGRHLRRLPPDRPGDGSTGRSLARRSHRRRAPERHHAPLLRRPGVLLDVAPDRSRRPGERGLLELLQLGQGASSRRRELHRGSRGDDLAEGRRRSSARHHAGPPGRASVAGDHRQDHRVGDAHHERRDQRPPVARPRARDPRARSEPDRVVPPRHHARDQAVRLPAPSRSPVHAADERERRQRRVPPGAALPGGLPRRQRLLAAVPRDEGEGVMVRVAIRSKAERGYRVLGMSQLFGAEFEEVEITDEQLAALDDEPKQFVEFRVLGKAVTGRQDVADAVAAEQPQGKRK